MAPDGSLERCDPGRLATFGREYDALVSKFFDESQYPRMPFPGTWQL